MSTHENRDLTEWILYINVVIAPIMKILEERCKCIKHVRRISKCPPQYKHNITFNS